MCVRRARAACACVWMYLPSVPRAFILLANVVKSLEGELLAFLDNVRLLEVLAFGHRLQTQHRVHTMWVNFFYT